MREFLNPRADANGAICRLDSSGPVPCFGWQLRESRHAYRGSLVVVGTIDNLLCPILVGNRLKLHTVLVFIAVVGGLILFGPAGLILGPVVLTVTMVLLEICNERTMANGKNLSP